MLEKHKDLKRHWCPQSEQFTGCDSLLTMMNRGWRLLKVAAVDHHERGKRRSVRVFTFMLAHNSLVRTMRIVENPTVGRIIERYDIRVFDRRALLTTPVDELMEQAPVAQQQVARRIANV